jgi:hypothetical protein
MMRCDCSALLQVLVVGPRHGTWGIERYGITPCKVCALQPLVLQAAQYQHSSMLPLSLGPAPTAMLLAVSALSIGGLQAVPALLHVIIAAG